MLREGNCYRHAAVPWEALGRQLTELNVGASGALLDEQRCLTDTVALLAAGGRLRALTLRPALYSFDLAVLSPLRGLQRLKLPWGVHGEGQPHRRAVHASVLLLPAPVPASSAAAMPYQRNGAGAAITLFLAPYSCGNG